MQYAVIKWHFLTAVRFGTSKGQLADSSYIMHSDTLFSALCQEALKLGGQEALQRLYDLCSSDRLLLSDTMPFMGENYFLPKPILQVERAAQESNSVLKKAYKKLKYIPTNLFATYLQSLQGTCQFDVEAVNFLLKDFVTNANRVMVGVKGNDAPQPFYVNTWTFAENAGLYVLAAFEDKADLDWLEQLMGNLGLQGIGGKKNSGLGKFEVEDVILLDKTCSEGLKALQKLLSSEGQWYMTLSGALPRVDELEHALDGAAYQVLKRSGFVDSTCYAEEQRKRRTLYILAAGSCFRNSFCGAIYDVADGGSHPVYRYAKPLFLGVSL